MRLFLTTVTIMALALGGTALAQPAPPDPPVGPSQRLAGGPDLRAPDQVAPAPATPVAPDQRAPRPLGTANDSSNRPNIVISKAHKPVADAPAAASDGGPSASVFVLIGLGVALVLLAGGYLGVRYRHRVAIADDLAAD